MSFSCTTRVREHLHDVLLQPECPDLLFSGSLLYNGDSSAHHLFWWYSKIFAFGPVLKILRFPDNYGIPCLSPLCEGCDPFTPLSISSMTCGGDTSFKHPAQHSQSGCQEELCFSTRHFQAAWTLHMLLISAFQLQYSGPHILCISGSKTTGAYLKSPLECSFLLVGGDIAVILLITSLRVWKHPPCHFVPKNWISCAGSLTLLCFMAKLVFRMIWIIFFPLRMLSSVGMGQVPACCSDLCLFRIARVITVLFQIFH